MKYGQNILRYESYQHVDKTDCEFEVTLIDLYILNQYEVSDCKYANDDLKAPKHSGDWIYRVIFDLAEMVLTRWCAIQVHLGIRYPIGLGFH